MIEQGELITIRGRTINFWKYVPYVVGLQEKCYCIFLIEEEFFGGDKKKHCVHVFDNTLIDKITSKEILALKENTLMEIKGTLEKNFRESYIVADSLEIVEK